MMTHPESCFRHTLYETCNCCSAKNKYSKNVYSVCHRRSLMHVHFARRLLRHSQISRHIRNGTQGLMIFPVVRVERRSSQSQVLNGMNCSILDIRPFLVNCVTCLSLQSQRLQDICDITKVKSVLRVLSVINHSLKTNIL